MTDADLRELRGMGRTLFFMAEKLNDTKDICECCGLGRYQDYDQHKWKISMTSSARSLMKLAREIGGDEV
tara:strand:+ start:75 stop:284 length:210 start_codon:yes stop_codon:yes gene_type:complete